MGDAEGVQDLEVVSKVLRSLAPKFNWVAVVIEESKDIAKLSLDDLCGMLQAHEVRVNCAAGKTVEKAFHVKTEHSTPNYSKVGGAWSSWGDGRGCGRAREKQPEKGVGLIAEEESTENLFMASCSMGEQSRTVWLIDSGCSNHMTRDKSLFSSLDESVSITVRLGNNKEIKVCGEGVIAVNTSVGTQKRLEGVQYVPGEESSNMRLEIKQQHVPTRYCEDWKLSDECKESNSGGTVASKVGASELQQFDVHGSQEAGIRVA
ncbi:uncharacterized protein LOC120277700 [Dioscorea cayenensis subsp. rotundata]|uniref:Uncharacterized protein LOC120277700 n=1 Tax=Dioscorea cayennensis subsp. rotundata TaxID=55577 RepID=A0AB40CQS3_DIOCR|nr:uncharacterized protein LOC120277700 [Dioscorea cayenensis subsp. rotundata]